MLISDNVIIRKLIYFNQSFMHVIYIENCQRIATKFLPIWKLCNQDNSNNRAMNKRLRLVRQVEVWIFLLNSSNEFV